MSNQSVSRNYRYRKTLLDHGNLGPELLTYAPHFVESEWNLGLNATINPQNELVYTGNADNDSIGVTVTQGTVYRVTYEIFDYVSGAHIPYIQGAAGVARTANGIYTEDMTAGAPTSYVIRSAGGALTAKIRNLSIREVLGP